MHRLCFVALAVVGCYNGPRPHDSDGSTTGDGSKDSCLGSGLLRICFDPEMHTIDDQTISDAVEWDTSASPTGPCTFIADQTDTDAPDVCVVLRKRFIVTGAGSLQAIGSLPLAIVATDEIFVGEDRTISVASYTKAGAGAALGSPLCAIAQPGQETPMMTTLGSGGGAAGAFGSTGGGGGAGASGGYSGGTPTSDRPAMFVRGGCSGAAGGRLGTTVGAAPGAGGGALYLVAANRIRIDGYINASGAGGGIAPVGGGGAGGGSGGFIALDSAMYSVGTTAKIFSVGGGGSGGGGTTTGAPGGTATPDMDPSEAMGGTGGGNGGVGSFAAGFTGGNGMSGGGGGGGGSGGRIFVGSRGAFNPPAGTVRPPHATSP